MHVLDAMELDSAGGDIERDGGWVNGGDGGAGVCGSEQHGLPSGAAADIEDAGWGRRGVMQAISAVAGSVYAVEEQSIPVVEGRVLQRAVREGGMVENRVLVGGHWWQMVQR